MLANARFQPATARRNAGAKAFYIRSAGLAPSLHLRLTGLLCMDRAGEQHDSDGEYLSDHDDPRFTIGKNYQRLIVP
ncbi:hypothetical protein ACRQ1B_00670 [Rhizobium panacihumi]|uniref:hypothetical protein n=1 Tax=Rhizobium panacihumi TaxID=2008450 RepID=UPI003D79AA68